MCRSRVEGASRAQVEIQIVSSCDALGWAGYSEGGPCTSVASVIPQTMFAHEEVKLLAARRRLEPADRVDPAGSALRF